MSGEQCGCSWWVKLSRGKLKSLQQVMRPDYWVSHILAANAEAEEFSKALKKGRTVGVADSCPWWLRSQSLFGCVRFSISEYQSRYLLSDLMWPIWLMCELQRNATATYCLIRYHSTPSFLMTISELWTKFTNKCTGCSIVSIPISYFPCIFLRLKQFLHY